MSFPLLLLTDGRFPTGGYAHSGGLEAAIEDGLGPDGIPAFLTGRLRGVTASESALVVLAARAARRGGFGRLLELDAEALARCPSPPLRTAASRLGSQLLRTAVEVWPRDETLAAYRAASAATPRPVAFGVVAAAASLDDAEAARAYVYEEASGIAAAAVRLAAVGSARTARWLVEATPLLEQVAAAAAAACEDERQVPGGFAPALELRSLAHAAREARLFAS